MKRIIILILCLCMLLTLFACGKKDGEVEGESSGEVTTVQTEGEEVCPLPELDYGGRIVTIHVRGDNDSISEIGLEDTGSHLSGKLYERTVATEERLNVKLNIAQGYSWNKYSQTIRDLRTSISAGNGSYDIISGWSARIPVLASEGLFKNLLDYEYIDTSAEWWSQSMVKSTTVNNSLYMITGDIAATYMDSCFAVLFNMRLAKSFGYDYSDFYEIVSSGEWTIDYLKTLSMDHYSDETGDGIRNKGDIFGLSMTAVGSDAFWDSCNISCVKNNGVERPVMEFDIEKVQNVYDKIEELTFENKGCLFDAKDDITEMGDVFKDGECLFSITTLATLANYTDMPDDYGVLPIPKYDVEQNDYYTHIMYDCSFWSIPIDATAADVSSAVMTSMGYDSNKTVIETHYEVLLKTRYVRDSESGYMIDLIYNSISLDFDNIYNEAMGYDLTKKETMPVYIFRMFAYNKENNASAWWIKNSEPLTATFNSLVDKFYVTAE